MSVLLMVEDLAIRMRIYCSRGESVGFDYVTSLRVAEKQNHIPRKQRKLPTSEIIRRSTRYYRWKMTFIVFIVYDFLSATPPAPPIPIPFITNGCRAHIIAPTTISSNGVTPIQIFKKSN